MISASHYVDPLVCRADVREPDVVERALEPEIGIARGTLRERGTFLWYACHVCGKATSQQRDERHECCAVEPADFSDSMS